MGEQVIIEGKTYYCKNDCGKVLEYESQIIMDNDDSFCSEECSDSFYKDLKTRQAEYEITR